MLFSLLNEPITFLFVALTIVIAITVHEFAHAWTADWLGDPTPRLQGRITLNPLAHLDPLGTLFIVLAGFGWGRPVQFDPFNLDNPRRDAAIIAVAGPVSNFVMALIAAGLLQLLIAMDAASALSVNFLFVFILLNITLGVFNLLPINPLDGFKIVGGILPEEQAHQWYALERYGFFFLLLMILPLGPGGRSMVDMIVSPLVSFLTALLLPAAGA